MSTRKVAMCVHHVLYAPSRDAPSPTTIECGYYPRHRLHRGTPNVLTLNEMNALGARSSDWCTYTGSLKN